MCHFARSANGSGSSRKWCLFAEHLDRKPLFADAPCISRLDIRYKHLSSVLHFLESFFFVCSYSVLEMLRKEKRKKREREREGKVESRERKGCGGRFTMLLTRTNNVALCSLKECTCKPHPTGIGGGGAVGGGARGGPHGGPHGGFRVPPQPPAQHRGPHSPVLPPKKSSQAAGGRRISLPEGPSQPPFFLQRVSSSCDVCGARRRSR